MTNPRQDACSSIHLDLISRRRKADELFLGTSAQITTGRYAGRWGLVTATSLDDRQGVMLLVQPYPMAIVDPATGLPPHMVEAKDLLYQHREARSFRHWREYAFHDDYEPCAKCGRRVKSPCNDARGYHEDGPWDVHCWEVFHPEPTL